LCVAALAAVKERAMAAREFIDVGEAQELSEDEEKELILDLIFALLDKHEALTMIALNEMVNQLVMQHGLRDAARFV
jgi:hypothetical protein